MHRSRIVKLLSVALLVAAACGQKTDPQPPVAESADTHPEVDQYKAPPMEVHFVKATEMQKAVVQGVLPMAKQNGQWIADHVVNDQLPARWRPHTPPVIKAAKAVAQAEDLTAAAKGSAEMAGACGDCHRATGINLSFDEKDPPPMGEDEASHMRRHEWGVDRLWEGLIGPSDESWRVGAEALKEAPLTRAESKDPDAAKQALADQIHGLGASAIDMTEPLERVALYGDLLATCAGCHAG